MTEHVLVTFYLFLFDFWRYNSPRLSSRCEMPHFMESREWIGHRSCREEGRFLSFSRSRDGGLLTISHSTGLVCVLDVMNGFQMLAETFTSHVCGIIKFLPDCRSPFCWHFPPGTVLHHLFCVKISVGNHGNFSLDVSRDIVSYRPWEHESFSESGFTLGDCVVGRAYDGIRVMNYSFLFMLNKDFALRSNPRTHFVEMLSVDELSRGGDGGEIIRNLVFSPDGETLYVMARESNGTRITAWKV